MCLGFVILFCLRTILHKASARTRLAHAKTWPNFSFRVAYAHRIFDDATQCKSCFRIASASACLELSSATASPTFRYAGFSLRKRNSRTSPLCNFIMEVFDAAQMVRICQNQQLSLSLAAQKQTITRTRIEEKDAREREAVEMQKEHHSTYRSTSDTTSENTQNAEPNTTVFGNPQNNTHTHAPILHWSPHLSHDESQGLYLAGWMASGTSHSLQNMTKPDNRFMSKTEQHDQAFL